MPTKIASGGECLEAATGWESGLSTSYFSCVGGLLERVSPLSSMALSGVASLGSRLDIARILKNNPK